MNVIIVARLFAEPFIIVKIAKVYRKFILRQSTGNSSKIDSFLFLFRFAQSWALLEGKLSGYCL